MIYDLIIIGFGKAGKTLALKAANLGKKVALIERSAQMYGGTCINIGCIPSKRLITAAKEAHYVTNAVNGEYYTLSVENKDKLITALRAKNFAMLNDNPNIDVFDGFGSFTSANSIRVTEASGQSYEIKSETIVINTGSVEVEPPFAVSSNLAYSSTQLLNLKSLPQSLIVVGGGFIGLEFASMFAAFGSKVSVLVRSKFLKNEDEDVASSVREALMTQGVEILENTQISGISEDTINFSQDGEVKSLKADAFLCALGRKAAIDGLNLAAAGVSTDERGDIAVNERLQTSSPNIYAVGDVRGGELFTYTSLDDFRIVFDALFGRGERTTDNRAIHANVLFTHTPLAKIGLSEREAKAAGRDVKILRLSLAAVPGAKVVMHDTGMLKAVVDASTGEILGAAFHCIHAHELINQIAIAMNFVNFCMK